MDPCCRGHGAERDYGNNGGRRNERGVRSGQDETIRKPWGLTMKKRLIWVIAIAAVLICAGLMGIKICRDLDNPIWSKIAAIDSAEIIGCYIGWPTLEGDHFSYTETDPEIVREIYDAMAHMKFREMEYSIPFDGPVYYVIALRPKEGKGYTIFSYAMGTVIAPGDVEYMAEITNLDELEEKYHWRTNLKNLILAAEAAREA